MPIDPISTFPVSMLKSPTQGSSQLGIETMRTSHQIAKSNVCAPLASHTCAHSSHTHELLFPSLQHCIYYIYTHTHTHSKASNALHQLMFSAYTPGYSDTSYCSDHNNSLVGSASKESITLRVRYRGNICRFTINKVRMVVVGNILMM